jgi:hypothetical protein
MESAKQEKKNLMQDMPIDDKGSAMMKKGCSAANYGSPMKMGGSWMSKHCQSAINYGSPMHQDIDPKSGEVEDMKKKTAALNELRRQRGDFGDIPASSASNPKSLKEDDSQKIADMKRKLKALNELRRQKGHFKK